MSGKHTKEERRSIRRHRIRKRVAGSADRPRLSVFRSGRHIYAQIIDDVRGVTLVQASSREPLPKVGEKVGEKAGEKEKGEKGEKVEKVGGKILAGSAVGKLVAERAKEKGIAKVCFDRGGYLYHGRVKAVADGARSGGLEF
jgi:large subunit ribosomal protein L18